MLDQGFWGHSSILDLRTTFGGWTPCQQIRLGSLGKDFTVLLIFLIPPTFFLFILPVSFLSIKAVRPHLKALIPAHSFTIFFLDLWWLLSLSTLQQLTYILASLKVHTVSLF